MDEKHSTVLRKLALLGAMDDYIVISWTRDLSTGTSERAGSA